MNDTLSKMESYEFCVGDFLFASWAFNLNILYQIFSSQSFCWNWQKFCFTERTNLIIKFFFFFRYLIDIPLIYTVQAISTNFMTFNAGDHRELVEISTNRANEFSLFQITDKFLVFFTIDIETEQIFKPLLFRIKIYFSTFFQFFYHALAT